MAELKTRPTEFSVEEFLNTIADETKRRDAFAVLDIMRQITGTQPILWGSSIVGWQRHYRY
jgi:hypothetical protein